MGFECEHKHVLLVCFPYMNFSFLQNQKKNSEIFRIFKKNNFLSLSTSYISYLLPLYILSSYHFKIIQFGINWLFKSTIVHFDCIYLLLSKSGYKIPRTHKSHIQTHNNNQPRQTFLKYYV